MNPDETKLALWLDDELSGTELAEMNAWSASQPEQLAARERLRKFRGILAENLTASEEPPYPDFFLTRINQGIREMQAASPPSTKTRASSFWRSWLMPVAACAGMVLAFSIGRQSGARETSVGKKETSQTMTAPMVYTPEEGVFAEWIPSPQNHTSVILLKGVSAIPDSTGFSETVYIPTAGEYDRTATLESGPTETSAR